MRTRAVLTVHRNKLPTGRERFHSKKRSKTFRQVENQDLVACSSLTYLASIYGGPNMAQALLGFMGTMKRKTVSVLVTTELMVK